jgi:putative heme-binding domain-containing protein
MSGNKLWTRVSLTLLLLASSRIIRAAEDPLLVAPTEAIPAEEQLTKFHLPPGFEIQLVAAEPDIRKPMNLAFDAKGRLWATQSTEYPYPAKGPEAPKDTIRVFEDWAPNGRAGKVSVFVDGLNIPIGLLPTLDGAIAYDLGQIRKFTDDDHDGRADRSDALYTGFGFRDTHGMSNSYRQWIDGWVYACHGYLNDSAVKGTQEEPVVMNSGNTYRYRGDGSHIEYFTHGQVNPFGMAFDPWGNLFTSDCHTLPAYMLLRGAWYPSFGKPHDGMGFGPTIMSHFHGSTGIAGIVYYAADYFPPEYRDTLFIGNPVTGKVNHDSLEVRGSSYWAVERPDFITCDDPWFRPVDICLGPDGALYIADFYNCIIGHYEVPLTHPRRDRSLGRIWRVVYNGTGDESPTVKSPEDLSVASLSRLIELLDDPNLNIRVMATNLIVERFGEQAISPIDDLLTHWESGFARAHGLWVLGRLGGLSDELVTALAADPQALVRVHLLKALAERSDWQRGEEMLVVAALADGNAFARRAAADALGRHPRAEFVQPLIDLWRNTPDEDTHLIHTARLALRAHFGVGGMYARAEELGLLNSENRKLLAEISLGVHTEAAAEFLAVSLARGEVSPENRSESARHIVRYAADDRLGALADQVFSLAVPDDGTLDANLVRPISQGLRERGVTWPNNLETRVADLVNQALSPASEEGRAVTALDLARDLKLTACQSHVLGLLTSAAPTAVRFVAIDTLANIAPEDSVAVFEAIAANDAEAPELRTKAVEALASSRIDAAKEAVGRLLPLVPLRVARGIARGMALQRPGVEELLGLISSGKASRELLRDPIVAERVRLSRIPDIEERVAEILEGLPPADESITERIQVVMASLADTDSHPSKGKEVFAKRCGLCHRLGGEGTKIGPELDGIGIRGAERLLEDILRPNANVDEAFWTTVFSTRDGRVLTGLLLREEGASFVVADAEGKEIRLPKADVEERRDSAVSPMPANLGETIPQEELVDLIGFLLRQTAKKQ